MPVLGEPVNSPPRHRLVTLPEVWICSVHVTKNVLLIEVDIYARVRLSLVHSLVVHSSFHESRERIEPFNPPVFCSRERILKHVKKDSQRKERVHKVANEDQEDIVESCTVILFISIDLLPDVPVFPVEVRDQSARPMSSTISGLFPKKTKPMASPNERCEGRSISNLRRLTSK